MAVSASNQTTEAERCSIECAVCQQTFDTELKRTRHLSSHDDTSIRYVLCTEIQRLTAELQRPPTKRMMDDAGKYSFSYYQTYFESWNAALRSAGVPVNIQQSIPEANLIDELQRLADEFDRVPTKRMMEEFGEFGKTTFARTFGSWNEAVASAGFEPNSSWFGTDGACIGIVNYGSNWDTARSRVLDRDNHRCQVCGVSNDELDLEHKLHVHHITQAHQFGAHDADLETDYTQMNRPENLVSLCASCHGKNEGRYTELEATAWIEMVRN